MRGKQAVKRVLTPDSKYDSQIVSKLINYVMFDGKKSIATRVVYEAFEIVGAETKGSPLEVFDLALKNIIPTGEVKSKRVANAGPWRSSLCFSLPLVASCRSRSQGPSNGREVG
jgi:ribosomal protein S7